MDSGPTIDAMRTAAQTLMSGDTRAKLHAVAGRSRRARCTEGCAAGRARRVQGLRARRRFDLERVGAQRAADERRTSHRPGQERRAHCATCPSWPKPRCPARSARPTSGCSSTDSPTSDSSRCASSKTSSSRSHAITNPVSCSKRSNTSRTRVHPEDLDAAWERGMDKEDFNVDAVPDGFHVSGFLNTVTGAKLKKVLDSVSAPRDKDDTRTGSQRRVQGLDDLLSCSARPTACRPTKAYVPTCRCSSTPTRCRPLPNTSKPRPRSRTSSPNPWPRRSEPAKLAGHGAIGPNLLMYFLCVSRLHRLPHETRRRSTAGADPQRRHRPLPTHPHPAPRGPRPPTRRLRSTRLQPHPPRDPPHDLLVTRRTNRPRPPHRTLRPVPPPAPPRTPQHHRQRRRRIRIHQPPPTTHPQTTKKPLPPSRLTKSPAAHRHVSQRRERRSVRDRTYESRSVVTISENAERSGDQHVPKLRRTRLRIFAATIRIPVTQSSFAISWSTIGAQYAVIVATRMTAATTYFTAAIVPMSSAWCNGGLRLHAD